jgi:hypothetical protein
MPRLPVRLCGLALMLAGWAATPPLALAVPAGPMFAFVLLGQGADGTTVPMVRSVMEGAGACPELRSAGGALLGTMTARTRPRGGRVRCRAGVRGPLPRGRGGNSGGGV